MASTAPASAPTQQEHWDRPREEAERLASALPPLLVEAERLTSGIWLGVHVLKLAPSATRLCSGARKR